jgi:FkbM family methyltransferase
MKADVFENYSELNLLLRNPYHSDGELTFVDVGAFRGGFSRAFAKKGWRVIAFEPEPTNFHYCCLRNKRFPEVTCVQKAVSNVSGKEVPFYVNELHPGRNSLKPFDDSHRSAALVETVRLDDALSELNIKNVTVLKIDTEGADFLGLKSFDFSCLHPEIVMVEFLDKRSKEYFGYTHHDMVSFMRQFGYKTYVSELGQRRKFDIFNQIGVSSYQFLQIAPYPLNHQPIMGNLIFVSQSMIPQFKKTLVNYLNDLDHYRYLRLPFHIMRLLFVKFPYGMQIFYKLRHLTGYRF